MGVPGAARARTPLNAREPFGLVNDSPVAGLASLPQRFLMI